MSARSRTPYARRIRAGRALLIVIAVACACAEETPRVALPSIETGPIATLTVEPAQMRIGEISTVEILVATSPGERVLPMAPPRLEGIWILDQSSPPVEQKQDRWHHRLLFRIRPQQLGIHQWPETSVQVESEDGQRVGLAIPGREIDVVSVVPEMEVRGSPFGMLEPEAEAPASGFPSSLAALLGAAGALLLVLGWRLATRTPRNAAPANGDEEVAPGVSGDLFAWAEGEIEGALGDLGADPRAAANRGARTLRRYVERRFEAETRPLTTPELAAAEPPLQVYSRWPHFLRILRALDDTRFRSATLPDALQSEVRSALEEVQSFVADSRPRGAS